MSFPITAKPKKSEWLALALVYPIAAFVSTALVSQGIDFFAPDFLTEDHASNRLRMAILFTATLLFEFRPETRRSIDEVWTNQFGFTVREYSIRSDRLEN